MSHTNTASEIKRGPIAYMAGHSVAANLVMVLCLVGGLLALSQIKQEVFPDFELDVVTITVPYPGASPEEVEEGVLTVVEEAVRGVEGVDEVTAVAREGSGTVSVELLRGADLQKMAQDIENEVNRITTFPEDTEEPVVQTFVRQRGVLDVILYGDAPIASLHQIAEQFRDRLLQDPGITQVSLSGIPPLEIRIEIPENSLRRYGVTLGEVASRIRNASVDLPGGGIDTAKGEILVRVKERRDYGRQFAELPVITTPGGSEIRLGDIANIEDDYEESDRYSLYNGLPAVTVEVYRVGEQTPVQVSKTVHEVLETFKPTLPRGIEAAIENDRSEVYNDRVKLLLRNGAIGLVLVLIVLGIFLEARLAFWVMMGIPISFMGSFLLLPATGVTINMISLFAYIIALGIVVDDAIVVGENIYHYRQEGLPFARAAVKGAREVAMPVTFSILTNIVAFLPIYFVPGFTGKIFRNIPVVVCLAFSISLIESLFILPAHLGHRKEKGTRRGISGWLHGRQQAFSQGFRKWVRKAYGPFLEACLRHRYLTLSVAVGVLIIFGAYAKSGRMGFQLFPVIESDFSQASVVLPYGAPVERTEAAIRRIEQGAREVLDAVGRPELFESMITDIGHSGSHTGNVRVTLAGPDVRERLGISTSEFTNRWRAAVGEIPGVDTMRFAADIGGPGGRGRPLTVQLSHYDMDVLEAASSELADAVNTYPKAKDVDDGFQPGKPQFDFAIKPEGKSLGLTARDVARQVRNSLYGAEALRQQRGRDEIKVMVRLPEEERASEQVVEDLMIRTPAATYIPLREVAAADRGRAYKTIDRRNGRRILEVSADVTPRSDAGKLIDALRKNELVELTRKYPDLTYSFEGAQADIGESLGSLQVTFILAMLSIYGLLAIPFRSYFQPLIVMTSIPFGIIGAFLGHLIMGYNLCIPSMFGIVALSGIVVNDSLVLIDFANRQRNNAGANAHDAVTNAGIQRFRPVMLTTLTTFAGLAPMIFERSLQARFLIPMALSLGFGILFATIITLVLVPSLYMMIEDAARLTAKLHSTLFGDPAPDTTDSNSRLV